MDFMPVYDVGRINVGVFYSNILYKITIDFKNFDNSLNLDNSLFASSGVVCELEVRDILGSKHHTKKVYDIYKDSVL